MFRFSGFGTERLEPQVLVILNNKVVNYALWEDAIVGRCDVPQFLIKPQTLNPLNPEALNPMPKPIPEAAKASFRHKVQGVETAATCMPSHFITKLLVPHRHRQRGHTHTHIHTPKP